MGDANASIPTVQPVLPRPMWGANPASAALNSVSFVSRVSITSGTLTFLIDLTTCTCRFTVERFDHL